MNAQSHTFDLKIESHQVKEVVNSIFHSILLHRTLGKFDYCGERKYSVGTVGYEDVDCDFIDLTYLRCTSKELHSAVSKPVAAFEQALNNSLVLAQDGTQSGQITLEFYNKKRNWPFADQRLPWELWTLDIEIKPRRTAIERQMSRLFVGETVGEKIMQIAGIINRQPYLPKIPSRSEVDLIFDTSYLTIQPYLFRVSFSTEPSPASMSMGNTIRRIFRETLPF